MRFGSTVLKVGGHEVDDPSWLAAMAEAVALHEGRLVIVHGGGKEVTALQRALGTEPEWRDGLRVTTDESLRAVRMVLSGLVNKRIVAALGEVGVEAVGISGEDGGTLTAALAQGGSLGLTGVIAAVQPRLIRAVVETGMVPVISPVSRGPGGQPLNVNADDAASAIASALEADRLMMISNVAGLMWSDAVLDEVDVREVEELIGGGLATGGMAPKLRAAARAAIAGVREVRIGGLDLVGDSPGGTRIVARQRQAVAI
jgi:acetylglutamate kinase